MKRNKTTRREPRSGIAPYTRYNKAPCIHSTAYQTWRRDAQRGAVLAEVRREESLADRGHRLYQAERNAKQRYKVRKGVAL